MYEYKRLAIASVLEKTNNLDKPILFPYAKEELRNLFFEKRYSSNIIYYVFADTLVKVKDKIDFSNVCFDDVYVSGMDFTNMHGVKINPQTIYEKNLYKTILNGVEFVSANKAVADLFDGVDVRYANFTGSKGAIINPQTVNLKSLNSCTLADVDFNGFPFDGVWVNGANFTGSLNAKIDPNFLVGIGRNTFADVIWNDVEFIDIFTPSSLKKGCDFIDKDSYNNLFLKVAEYKEEVKSLIKN